MKVLLIVTNVDWFLISHRLILAKAALDSGWKVYVACEDTGRKDEIVTEGLEFLDFPLSRSGTNIIEEIKLLYRFKTLYKRIKPDVVHQITIKPVVYGTIVAKRLGIRGVVNAISGLGYMFTSGKVGIMQRLILGLMKYGSNRPNVSFIFQNMDDMDTLNEFSVLNNNVDKYLIKGSGVNLEEYAYTPLPQSDRVRILLPCRMLWDKGVSELREASNILRSRFEKKLQFVLVGMADNENRSGVSDSYLNDWSDGNYVVWEGHQNNMIEYYQSSHVVVLPSYREGLPKALIEACASGRPIVTTDAIGCRDCVDEGVNGFKVPIGDAIALASAIEKLVNDRDLMDAMGKAGRLKAEAEFDVNEVVNRHLEIYKSVLSK